MNEKGTETDSRFSVYSMFCQQSHKSQTVEGECGRKEFLFLRLEWQKKQQNPPLADNGISFLFFEGRESSAIYWQ